MDADTSPMVRDSRLDDVNDYAFTDDTTLRWRSRLPDDAPFESASRTYVLRYQLSNIVLKNDDAYTLDHDFLFSDRQGTITRASVALTLDPAWQPQAEVQSGVDLVPPPLALFPQAERLLDRVFFAREAATVDGPLSKCPLVRRQLDSHRGKVWH